MFHHFRPVLDHGLTWWWHSGFLCSLPLWAAEEPAPGLNAPSSDTEQPDHERKEEKSKEKNEKQTNSVKRWKDLNHKCKCIIPSLKIEILLKFK